MPERPRLELTAALIALILCAAFAASFAFGLGGRSSGTGADGPAAADLPPDRGRVEVLNGSQRSGMARAATAQLRDAGFDVVYFGNAADPADSSVVVSRVPNDAIARAVAAELGVHRVRVEPDSTRFLEVTVILGLDWAPAGH